MSQAGWRTGSLVAFTEGEGPGRPPTAGARWAWLALAGALTGAIVAMMSTDTLCPEHRAWVQLIGTVALVTIVCAVVGLLRGWAGAPVLASAAALGGVAMGLLDAVHDPTRGRLIAVGFGAVAVGASVVALRLVRGAWWERSRLDAAVAVPMMGTRVEPAARSDSTSLDAARAQADPIQH
jgi:hypothetical protein